MKADELLKRLENVKIDERYEIAEYLVQTFGDKEDPFPFYLMAKNKTIYDLDSYMDLLKSNKISPNNIFVYVDNNYFIEYSPLAYFYPFLYSVYPLVKAYLSKLGLEADLYHIAPATGLKYVAIVDKFSEINRGVVEVADIDNVATNIHLPALIQDSIRNKHIYDVIDEIVSQISSQKLFAGYNFSIARKIICKYYREHIKLFNKKIEDITDAYNHIFQPFRIEYDLETKQFIMGVKRDEKPRLSKTG